MSTKDIYSIWYIMSYNITGQVYQNTRVEDNKIIDYIYPLRYNSTYKGKISPVPVPLSTINFNGNQVMKILGGTDGFYTKNPHFKLSSKYTISLWYYFPFTTNTANIYFGIYSLSPDNSIKIIDGCTFIPENKYSSITSKYFIMPSSSPQTTSISSDQIPLKSNQWVHIAFIKDSKTCYLYINGEKSLTFTNAFNTEGYYLYHIPAAITVGFASYYLYLFNPVFINDQILWTSNFTPPSDYLINDEKYFQKPSNKNISYPFNFDYNDYFDKAYLY